MSVFVFAVLALGSVLITGAIAVTLIAAIPLPVLERAQRHGRFAGLASSVSTPGSGSPTHRRASSGQRAALHIA